MPDLDASPASQKNSISNYILGMRPALRLGVCLLLAGVAATGQAPLGFWPVSILALGAIYGIFSLGWSGWGSAWIGLAAGTGYYLVSLSWIVEPFLIDAKAHAWMAPFALVFLAVGLGLFWMVAFGVARKCGGGALAWIATLTMAEAVRGTVFTGFPWAQVGHVWIDTPVLQWASVAGSLGLTVLVLFGAVTCLWLCTGRRLIGTVALCFLVGIYLAAPLINPYIAVPENAPIVRLVQPNAPQHEKWDPEKVQGFYNRQVSYTAAGDPPDLVVWPETAVPVLLNNPGETFNHIAKAARGAPVVLGAQRVDGLQFYNSLAVIGAQGQVTTTYDKHHLVPFGEYLPMGDFLAQFGLTGLAAKNGNGYSAGPGAQLIDVPGLGKALPLICYEAVFPQDVASAPERPDFLLLITNDAWFGDVSGPHQHLAQARLRSVEQALPMIRAANTGVSAMIDSRGEVTGHLPLGTAGWLDVSLPPAGKVSIYGRTGDWPVLIFVLVLLGVSMARHRGINRPI